MPTTHAFKFLCKDLAADVPPTPVAVVVGPDAALRGWTIQHLTGNDNVSFHDGETAQWSDLGDDLMTASLFGGNENKTAVVRAADKFVSSFREQLEKYVPSPSSTATLVLELTTLPVNTRLHKAVEAAGTRINCTAEVGKKVGVMAADRRKFITGFIADRHRCKLAAGAADALVELLGEDLGMIDTEVAKLAVYHPVGGKIDETFVRDTVGGWRGQTIWQTAAAMAAGNAVEAIEQLDRLLSGGERVIALLPQLAYTLRQLGTATARVEFDQAHGQPVRLPEALAAAGVRPYGLGEAKTQLQGLTRARARRILPWLLDADLRLKGTHSTAGPDRLLLERLVFKMSAAAKPKVG